MGHIDLRRLFPIRPRRLPGSRWLLAAAVLGGLLTFFAACGVFGRGVFDQNAADVDPAFGAALFFSVTIAYLVPVFGYISERTLAAFQALAPVLNVAPETRDAWQRRIYLKPRRWLVIVLCVSLISGIVHNVVLNGSVAGLVAEARSSPAAASIIVGTELIWIVFTFVVAALLDNALLFNRAAHHARINPFDARRLRPFATVAVISTLGLIGAQAAFPIMSIEGGLDPLAYVPGLLASGIPMLLLAALPVWPVHRRLVDRKSDLLTRLDRRIAALPLPDPDDAEAMAGDLDALAPLLHYRRELSQTPEWPFDQGVLTRLGLYLIIPPLTWVGAALIENVVEALL